MWYTSNKTILLILWEGKRITIYMYENREIKEGIKNLEKNDEKREHRKLELREKRVASKRKTINGCKHKL